MNYLISALKFVWSLRKNKVMLSKIGMGTVYFTSISIAAAIMYGVVSPYVNKSLNESKGNLKNDIVNSLITKIDSIHGIENKVLLSISTNVDYLMYKDSVIGIRIENQNAIIAELIKSSNLKLNKTIELLELVYTNQNTLSTKIEYNKERKISVKKQ